MTRPPPSKAGVLCGALMGGVITQVAPCYPERDGDQQDDDLSGDKFKLQDIGRAFSSLEGRWGQEQGDEPDMEVQQTNEEQAELPEEVVASARAAPVLRVWGIADDPPVEVGLNREVTMQQDAEQVDDSPQLLDRRGVVPVNQRSAA